MTELAEVRFEFKTADWPYRYTLTPVAQIEFANGSRTETIVLPGPYMITSPDRLTNNLARSVCSTSVLPLEKCAVLAGKDTTADTHRLHLEVRTTQTCDEIQLWRRQ